MADVSLSTSTFQQSMFNTTIKSAKNHFNLGVPFILDFLKFYEPHGNSTDQYIRTGNIMIQINDHPTCIIFTLGAFTIWVNSKTMKVIQIGYDNESVHLNDNGVFYEKFMTYSEFEPYLFQLSTLTTDGIDMDIFNQILEYNKGLE